MSFADNLVYLRQHYGITQEGLAEQLSVSRQTVSKWKAGTNYPEMDKLLQLCDRFIPASTTSCAAACMSSKKTTPSATTST